MEDNHHDRSDMTSTLRTASLAPTALPTKVVRPPPFSRRLTRSLFIRDANTRGPAPNFRASIKSAATYSWINVLLVFNPIAWALHYTHQVDGAIFAVSLLGIVPLAGLLGHGTETIALYTGDALGGLINASLGNATEFIIAILLLVKCEIRVVQASLLGGLLSNLLLVTGMAFLVGGIRFSEQEFQQSAAQLNTSLLTLAVIALVLPTVFAFAYDQSNGEDKERDIVLEMSRGSAIILIVIYLSYMVFQLYSHSHLYNPENDVLRDTPRMSRTSTHSSRSSRRSARSCSPVRRSGQMIAAPALSPVRPMPLPQRPSIHPCGPLAFGSAAQLGLGARLRLATPLRVPQDAESAPFEKRFQRPTVRDELDVASLNEHDNILEKETPKMNLTTAISMLVGTTALTYLTAEALTDSLEGIGESGAVSKEWLGLILLAIVGNAAEHVTAVFVAYRNKVDLALAVSVGSCIQIALFVIPLLVLIGWIIGKPLSLLFDPLEVVTLFLSVLLVRFATEDGRTHYMSGILLFGSYVLIAFSFWYYPHEGTTTGNLFAEC
ncbi:calcium/proton exchanger [Cylindrobasidium torrendii FP15055 ss-10]|uniref:Calcium/proton exchanger n=1 Tax=Cylindrobasidium torrendii FP15055 ss-10 TaxID=1314674 RepID=A0A0D7BMR2_9AGAR|nr:calcium/proton exchanger [Cylindrobasidium torrendii FP15055 ss-10]